MVEHCVYFSFHICLSIARALHRHLESRYHGIPWPSVTVPCSDLLNLLIKRINEASVSEICASLCVVVEIFLIRDCIRCLEY